MNCVGVSGKGFGWRPVNKERVGEGRGREDKAGQILEEHAKEWSLLWCNGKPTKHFK